MRIRPEATAKRVVGMAESDSRVLTASITLVNIYNNPMRGKHHLSAIIGDIDEPSKALARLRLEKKVKGRALRH